MRLTVVTENPGLLEGQDVEIAASLGEVATELVAFLPATLIPAEGWARALRNAHRMPWDGVGPTVAPGGQSTPEEWAHYLHHYAEWAPPQPPMPTAHLPPGSAYRRFGPRLYLEPLAAVTALPQTPAGYTPRPLTMLRRLPRLVRAARRLRVPPRALVLALIL